MNAPSDLTSIRSLREHILFGVCMKLVTLEGLPGTCTDVLKIMHQNKSFSVLPTPLLPAPTSTHSAHANDVCMVLSNMLTRLKMLRRMHAVAGENDIVCGAHWVESPPVGLRGRMALHKICQDLTLAVAEDMQIDIEEHVIVLLKSSIHECFEHLLMESHIVTMNDIIEEAGFLESLSLMDGVMSAFPYVVRHVPCPPHMKDNMIDLLMTASRISTLLNGFFPSGSRPRVLGSSPQK